MRTKRGRKTSEDFERCVWCKKTFIMEEFYGHSCFKERNPVKDITINFSYETETEDGDKTIHAYDLKGNIYRLTKPNPTKLARLKLEASAESKQEDYADWLRRECNRTHKSPLYRLFKCS